MGCVSSKIMTKSASFREEFNRSMRRRTNSVDEIIITKNGGDQFVALLCTANTVARRRKERSPAQEPDGSKNSSEIEHANSNPNSTKQPEKNEIETINTWKLLAGPEDDTQGEKHQIGPSRSFQTVQDFDAMVAANKSLDHSESSINADKDIAKEERVSELKHASGDKNAGSEEGNITSEKGSRRKAMAKELTALEVPSSFEFMRAGSLRDWLLQGGQVFSPGSYTTPKFGNFVSPGANDGEATIVFDPELVQQFEQAMEQMTVEEESVLKEIIENLEGANEESISGIGTSKSTRVEL